MAKWLIGIILILTIPAVFGIDCQWSEDNATNWRNVTYMSDSIPEGLEFGLQQDTDYYFRCKNSTTEWGYVSQRTKEGLDNMWLLAILLIPLGLAFMFILWGNSLEEEQMPLKWFMRFLALLMVYVLYAGADIIIGKYPEYSGLANLFNIEVFGWIFWTIIAVFLIYFMYKLFLAMQQKKMDDFERGVIK